MAEEKIFGGYEFREYYNVDDIFKQVMAGKSLPSCLSELDAELKRVEDPILQMHLIRRKAGSSDPRICHPIESWVKVDVTPEEKTKMLDYTGGKRMHIGGIGFVEPSRIISYYCPSCDREYEGAPEIGIETEAELSLLPDQIGYVSATCTNKDCKAHVIAFCPLYKDQKPDIKYIKQDWEGIFIKPKNEDLEKLLDEMKQSVNETNGYVTGKLEKRAKKWSNLLNYPIEDKLKEIYLWAHQIEREHYAKHFVEDVNDLYNLIDEHHGDLSFFYDKEYGITPVYEGNYQAFLNFFEVLDEDFKIPENDDVKKKINYIIDAQKKDLEKDMAKLDLALTELENRKKELKGKIKTLPRIE